MPGRQSHGAPPSKKVKARANNKKRSINAFAIAAQENPEKVKIRNHRLGESEAGDRRGKRARGGEESGDDNVSNIKKSRKNPIQGRDDELDIDVGSDSDGNEWRMGQVDSEDDSELDSDEAFGDSDEERFEGFAFSGSSGNGKTEKKNRNPKSRNLTLDEDELGSQISSGSEDDDLGEEAVDLAAILDDADGDGGGGGEVPKEQSGSDGETGSDGLSEESGDDDEESFTSSIDESDEHDPAKIDALQNLIANLPQSETVDSSSRKRDNGANEYSTPSDFGITAKTKLTLEDLGLPSIRDPFVKKSIKLLASESKGDQKRSGASGKLEVPLAKRQQDRLDRSVAYDKSKETLDRWTDTIQHNRRAEHLVFPLTDSDAKVANINARLQPTTNSKPFNELEATIQTILEESGLAAADGRDSEDKLVEFEELQANKMSYEEVKARRDQLRMARELLFREEARAKRIKKIKSRSYRKVHRKQREKEDRMNKEALIDAGVEPSEDEQEQQDRRRAEERMGSKHRSSKWAKATKQIGRAAWDEDARHGLMEMVRRGEELRKRVEGKNSKSDDSGDSGSSADEFGDKDSAGNDRNRAKILKKLQDTGYPKTMVQNGPGSKLSSMRFMLKAEASRKKENDEMVEQIRKELDGEEESTAEDGQGGKEVGRRAFGPGTSEKNGRSLRPSHRIIGSEESDHDDENVIEIDTKVQTQVSLSKSLPRRKGKSSDVEKGVSQLRKDPVKAASSATTTKDNEGGAWSKGIESRKSAIQTSEARRRKQSSRVDNEVGELDLSQAAVVAKQVFPKKAKKTQKSIQVEDPDDNDSEADDTAGLPFAIQDQELIKKAFAGADVVGEFEAEKRQTIQDEDEKVIDNTLPGWGNWVGDGLSRKEKRQNSGRFLTKSDGIKERDRKDAKLERVIINQKRVKKNTKYLASTLPHPFETRQQYERSLRLPVGPEWTTKETFQDATKPRILIKQGIIAPMLKPLL